MPTVAPPHSLDLSHHLSKRTLARQPSAMKAMGRLLADKKDLLSLGGGLPHASLFPMSHATFDIPAFSTLGNVASWVDKTADKDTIHFDKPAPGRPLDADGKLNDLNVLLQYGLVNGYQELIRQLGQLNTLLHGRATEDAGVYLTLGNTDGVSKTFELLLEPDVDTLLVEEYTFPSSVNSARAKGARIHPIKIDTDGIIPQDLDDTLTNWPPGRGRKPHVLYTIPCGQNPTGTVLSEERYQQIYAIAQKHDLVIVEDDPYYPLQYADTAPELPPAPAQPNDEDALAVAQVFNAHAGVRSFLSRDVDGRVIRIDTFSKVYGPGIRLGWISAQAEFIERLSRIGETTTATPNNIAQGILSSYLSEKHWGVGGFIRWMYGVRLDYQAKRDFFVDRLQAYAPGDLVSTVPARAGMFQWVKVDVAQHPRYTVETESELVDELWTHLIDTGVLVLPARLFSQREGAELGYFRATFAGDLDGIDKSLERFGQGIQSFFGR